MASSLDRAPPKVLVIAGSDCSGGAGLEADQRVLAAHQCYAMTATTALTVQNTTGVRNVHVTPSDIVAQQIDAVIDDIKVDVVKIGMLACAETVRVVATKLAEHKINNVVLDPVMVSTSGAQLLPGNAVRDLRTLLIPRTTIITPNVPEATLLLRDADIQYTTPSSLGDLKTLARLVHGLGPKAVLIKGGHIPLKMNYTRATEDEDKLLTVDVLYDGHTYSIVEAPYSKSKNTHGTGCSLASAIAANLALKQALPQAVKNACRYVGVGITTSHNIGRGSGPINHFHNVQSLPFAAGHFTEYLTERPDVAPVWHRYTYHPFARQMANGTLPLNLFKDYLVQDYLYLTHFARTNALASYKSKKMEQIIAGAQNVLAIEREMHLHLEYCRDFGLEKEDIERRRESQACVAYSRYILDIGQSEDWLALQIGLLPCLLGYGVTAKRLHTEQSSVIVGNKYWKWVENYVAEDYQQAVRKGSALIEEHVIKQSPARIEELVQIFIRATEMEIQFWEADAHIDQGQTG